MKEDKLVQKLMIDEKRCYLFGRNPQMNDFCIDHASCCDSVFRWMLAVCLMLGAQVEKNQGKMRSLLYTEWGMGDGSERKQH